MKCRLSLILNAKLKASICMYISRFKGAAIQEVNLFRIDKASPFFSWKCFDAITWLLSVFYKRGNFAWSQCWWESWRRVCEGLLTCLGRVVWSLHGNWGPNCLGPCCVLRMVPHTVSSGPRVGELAVGCICTFPLIWMMNQHKAWVHLTCFNYVSQKQCIR